MGLLSDVKADLSAAPARAYRLVTPSDTADLPDGPCRALILSADGAVTLNDHTATKCTGIPLVKGWNPGGAMRIWSTGTDAITIWAVY